MNKVTEEVWDFWNNQTNRRKVRVALSKALDENEEKILVKMQIAKDKEAQRYEEQLQREREQLAEENRIREEKEKEQKEKDLEIAEHMPSVPFLKPRQ